MKKRGLATLLTLALLFSFAPTTAHADILEEDLPDVSASSYAIIDGDTKQVLFGKNYDKAMSPGNLVQVMTAVLVIEEGNLNDSVTVPEIPESANEGNRLYLRKGEKINLNELLEGIVVYNANDAAVAAANHIAGSTDAFVDEMNARAKELGMDDTTFTSVFGTAKGQTTTAKDMAILAAHASSLSKYVELAIQPTLEWNSEMNQDTVTNANGMQDVEPDAVGVKVNTENPVNLAASITKDKRTIVGAMLKCDDEDSAYTEMQTALTYGLENTSVANMVTKGDTVAALNFDTNKSVNVVASKSFAITTASSNTGVFRSTVVLDTVDLPVNEGDKIGTMQIYNGDNLVQEIPLTAQNTVKAGVNWWFVLTLLLLVALIAVLAFFVLLNPQVLGKKPMRKKKPQANTKTNASHSHATSHDGQAKTHQSRPKTTSRPSGTRPSQTKPLGTKRPVSTHPTNAQKHPSTGSSAGRQGLEQRLKEKSETPRNGGRR